MVYAVCYDGIQSVRMDAVVCCMVFEVFSDLDPFFSDVILFCEDVFDADIRIVHERLFRRLCGFDLS